jgi:1-acyl-sn-glycerol-3-phosphate acyltransferase
MTADGQGWEDNRIVLKSLTDKLVTILLWGYFTLGYLLIFAPLHALAFLLAPDRQRGFQLVNHFFYRGFFVLVRVLIRGVSIRVEPAVRQIRQAVVISNHRSYLDPLLLIALFPHHRTIVKSRLFRIPLFGTMLKISGYLPASMEEDLGKLFITQMESLGDFFTKGGILFAFPEGTRSRNGGVGRLNRGAFKIARMHKVPIQVIRITSTDALFPPGKTWFDTHSRPEIRITLLKTITPAEFDGGNAIGRFVKQVADLLQA